MSKFRGLRKFGLSIVGEIPWGTHLCEFYQTKEDLIDILVPYFKAGLENNEFCMWITAEPLNEEEAKKALEKSMPELSKYLKRGQIEIISYKDWYIKDGGFNSDRVLQGWVSKLENALGKGFAGLRLTGNNFWLEKSDWKAFTDYEEAVNNVIGQCKMIAVCTYSLDKCNAHEILDVMKNHQFALVKRGGKWELIESLEKKRIADDLLKSERKFTALYDAMTEGVVIHDIVYDNYGNAVDYVITDVNPSYEKITGLSKKQAVGKKASELYGTGAPPYLDVSAKVASSGKPVFFETYFPPMQKHFSVSVFSQSKGKFTAVFHDITERKVAEEALRASEHRWATTLSSIGDAVIATDIAGKITFMNHAAEGLTGWTLAEASKKPLKEVFNIINEHTRHEVDDPVARVLEKGLIIGLANHTLLIRKDGTEIPIDDSGAPIKDEKGEIIGVVLVFRDIAERRKMEAELSNLAKFPSENHNVILRLSKDGKLLYSNPASKRLLGNWLENLNLSLPKHWRKNLTEALSSGKKLGFEEQIRESTFSFTVAPIVSEGYVNVYGEDITERKKAEESLEKEQQELNRIIDSSPIIIFYKDKEGKLIRVNEAFAEALKIPKEKFLGKTVFDLYSAEIARGMANDDLEVLKSGRPRLGIIEQYESASGMRWVQTDKVPIFDKNGISTGLVGFAQDITERRKAEASLVESERRYRSLFANMNSGFVFCKIVSDNDGKPINYVILEVNDDFEKLTGLGKEAVLGKRVSEVFFSVEKDPAGWIGIYGRVATTGEPARFESYFELLKKWFSVAAYRPEIGYFALAFDDITERKKAERELVDTLEASHRRQAEVSALLEASKAVLVNREFSRAARSIFASCKDLLGATAGYVALLSRDKMENEVLFLDSGGLPCVVDPLLPMPIRGLRAEAYSKGKVVYCNDFPSSEWSSLMPEGHVMLKNVLFAPLTIDDKAVGIIGLANKTGDFTERDAQMASAFGEIASVALINSQMLEKLEENEKLLKAHSERLEEMVEEKTKLLRDSERLATIGQTAGMVGHDIRNPLQAIIGDVYLAKSDVASMPEDAKKESLQESLLAIEKNVEYINKIVADLQDYAKPLRPHAEVTDLKAIINDLVEKRGLPESIQVNVRVTKEARKVMADSAYVKRIMGNLVTNAVQAMPNGGKLLINAYNEAGNAVITVEDTGMGIPDEAKPKLFTPLFTTKSKGQGFGLAVVKRLTEALNGTVTLESQEGKGTKFTITLPQEI